MPLDAIAKGARMAWQAGAHRFRCRIAHRRLEWGKFLVGGQIPLNQLYPWSSQYPPRYLSVTAISITYFGFLKPSLVGIRTFIGKPYLRGRISPSNLKAIWVCGCSAVGMSIEVE